MFFFLNATLTTYSDTKGMTHRRFFLRAFAGLSVLSLIPALPVTAKAAEEKKKGGGAGYTQFPTLSVFTEMGRMHHGTLSLDLGLYSEDPKLVARIKLYQPRLQDAYITFLQGYAGNLSRSSIVDTDYIGSQLQNTTDRVLGVKGAKVLLGSILLN